MVIATQIFNEIIVKLRSMIKNFCEIYFMRPILYVVVNVLIVGSLLEKCPMGNWQPVDGRVVEQGSLGAIFDTVIRWW